MGATSYISEKLGGLLTSIKNDGFLSAGKAAAQNIGAALGSIGTSVATFATVGLTAAVSAALAQIEYNEETHKIKDLYRDELAAQLHKNGKKISKQDLATLAQGDESQGVEANNVVAEALQKNKKKRNLGMVLSVTATLGAMAVVNVVAAMGLIATGVGLAPVAAHAITGLIAYNIIKQPMHWIGDRLFGLDEATAHDHIVEIKKDRDNGHPISREQVFSVFASANQQLGDFIRSQYGKSYDELEVVDKQHITREIGKLVPIAQYTDNINAGRINVTELAFAAEGKISGVMPKDLKREPKQGLIGGFMKSCRNLVARFTPDHLVPEPVSQMATNMTDIIAHHKHTPVEYDNPAPTVPFTQRLGLTRADTSVSHVERYERGQSDRSAIVQM